MNGHLTTETNPNGQRTYEKLPNLISHPIYANRFYKGIPKHTHSLAKIEKDWQKPSVGEDVAHLKLIYFDGRTSPSESCFTLSAKA